MKPEEKHILKRHPELKENPYSVPEGYFSNLSGRIMERVKGEDEKTASKTGPRMQNQWHAWRSQLALAASIVGFALISYTAIKLILPEQSMPNEYIDLSLLEEMDAIPGDSYLIDVYALEEETSSDEAWINEAETYLTNSDIEFDLISDIY